jgi:glycosyltransferase involved in cell wall biosynthesis
VWLAALLPFIPDTPVITTIHDVDYHPGDTTSQRVPRWCTNLFIRQSSAVIVHGGGLLRAAAARLPVRLDQLHIIPHLALPFYKEFALHNGLQKEADQPFTALFFGRVQRYKGIDVLIDAANHVATSFTDVRFVIAGQADALMRTTLGAARAPLFDVRDRFIPDIETAELFTCADLVILPYVEASQSGVLAIAYSFGVPVVATDVGELGTTVRNDNTGVVVPANDSTSLANAIIHLSANSDLRRTLGKNALALAETSLGRAAIGARALAVYREVIDACTLRGPSTRRSN